MSTVPVKRIDPLLGLMKTLLFSTCNQLVLNRDNREELGYVMGDEA
jgi:hypothetical protein